MEAAPNDQVRGDLALAGEYVRRARISMRMSIDEAAAAAGMSPVTWARVEKGQPVRSLTYAGIERVLHWRTGSVERLLADGAAPGFEELALTDTGTATEGVSTRNVDPDDPVERLIRDIYAHENMPEERKNELVRLIRRAEAQAEAERQAARDELNRWRRRA